MCFSDKRLVAGDITPDLEQLDFPEKHPGNAD